MEIDSKDLIPVAAMKDIEPGKIFYLQVTPGDYARCVINQEELKDERRAHVVRHLTQKYFSEKRLFFNRNNPGHHFVKIK